MIYVTYIPDDFIRRSFWCAFQSIQSNPGQERAAKELINEHQKIREKVGVFFCGENWIEKMVGQ